MNENDKVTMVMVMVDEKKSYPKQTEKNIFIKTDCQNIISFSEENLSVIFYLFIFCSVSGSRYLFIERENAKKTKQE